MVHRTEKPACCSLCQHSCKAAHLCAARQQGRTEAQFFEAGACGAHFRAQLFIFAAVQHMGRLHKNTPRPGVRGRLQRLRRGRHRFAPARQNTAHCFAGKGTGMRQARLPRQRLLYGIYARSRGRHTGAEAGDQDMVKQFASLVSFY